MTGLHKEMILQALKLGYENLKNEISEEETHLMKRSIDIIEKMEVGDNLIKIENAYIEDADDFPSYAICGRVNELFVAQREFDKIKHIK